MSDSSVVYRVSGRYVYALKKNQSTAPSAFPRVPWQDFGWGDNYLPVATFVLGTLMPPQGSSAAGRRAEAPELGPAGRGWGLAPGMAGRGRRRHRPDQRGGPLGWIAAATMQPRNPARPRAVAITPAGESGPGRPPRSSKIRSR